MKLKLDFDLYQGRTRLKVWWKKVKEHFIEVQSAINTLDDDIGAEAEARAAADNTLQSNINAEAEARANADNDIWDQVEDLIVDLREHKNNPIQIFKLSEHGSASLYTSEDIELKRLYIIENDTNEDFVYFQDGGDCVTALSEAIPAGESRMCVRIKSSVSGADYEDGYIYILNDSGVLKKLTAEHNSRVAAESELAGKISTETSAREAADNDLSAEINAEARARANADIAINNAIGSEADARAEADRTLGENVSELRAAVIELQEADAGIETEIRAEAATREAAVSTLADRIAAEETERQRVDAIFGEQLLRDEEDILDIKSKAHTHDNKDVIDDITAEDVERLRELQTQVTREELEAEAEERMKGDAESAALFDYLEDVAFGHEREFHLLYLALGVEHYNGSLFGTPYDDETLDGGDFDTEPENTIDFGGFEPMVITIGADTVIDGGGYSDTGGVVFDGGVY